MYWGVYVLVYEVPLSTQEKKTTREAKSGPEKLNVCKG